MSEGKLKSFRIEDILRKKESKNSDYTDTTSLPKSIYSSVVKENYHLKNVRMNTDRQRFYRNSYYWNYVNLFIIV